MTSDLSSAQPANPAKPATLPAAVPVLLSFLAGYVDSCTFLALFGLFVAQVTGSFVVVGTQLVARQEGAAIKLSAIPVFFLAALATTVLVRHAGRRALPTCLALEAALLAGLLACWLRWGPFSNPDAPSVLAASLFGLAAMGVQSTLVRLVAKGFPSTSVMTTNTTQLAIDTAELAMTWRAARRAPGDAAIAAEHARVKGRMRVLWPIVLTFMVGTVIGAAAYARFDLWCILLAIALAGALACWAHLRGGEGP
jgi:uncharacterized membrane protein YoaK (UPF0700 family)